MKNESGSYIEKSYFNNAKSIATCLMIGFLLSPAGLGAVEDTVSNEPNVCGKSLFKSIGSGIQNETYQTATSTWSSVDNVSDLKIKQPVVSAINVSESLNVIDKLAFLAVDEDIDNEIELYFASKPIKTKTILINPRIKQG